MNAQEIARVAYAAGFRDQALGTIIAIALAESHGNPSAHNTNRATGDDSYGLTQINMIGEPGRPGPHGEVYGPARRRQFGITSNSELLDPATNMRAAFSLSGGGSHFSDWSTYNDGTYNSYREAAGAGLVGLIGPGDTLGDVPGEVAGAAKGAIQSLLGLNDLAEQVLTVGLSITFTVAALGLIAVGLFKLTGKDVGDAIDAGGQAVGAAGLAAAVI